MRNYVGDRTFWSGASLMRWICLAPRSTPDEVLSAAKSSCHHPSSPESSSDRSMTPASESAENCEMMQSADGAAERGKNYRASKSCLAG